MSNKKPKIQQEEIIIKQKYPEKIKKNSKQYHKKRQAFNKTTNNIIIKKYYYFLKVIKRKWRKIKGKIVDKSVNFGFKSWVSLAYPYLFCLIVLIILPLLIVLLYSLIIANHSALIFNFTLENFYTFFSENSFVFVLLHSILYSFFASVLAVIIAYPVAYIMAFKLKKLIAKNIWILIALPIWINILLKTIGVQIIFKIISDKILIGSAIGVILAMTYMFLPLVILPIYNTLEKTNINLLEASQDLGASPTKTFWKITFRYSIPGVIAGFTLMMLTAMTSLTVVKYIGDGKMQMIGNIIESYFSRGGNLPLGAAISVILGLIAVVIIVGLKFLGRFATGKKIWGN